MASPSRADRVTRPGLLVLDLDGTLLIGDDPAIDHARELARLADLRTPGAGAQLVGRLEAFLAGDASLDAPDGYLAARNLALAAGLVESDITRAFLAHRARMAAGTVPFRAPDGARALLEEVRATAVRVAIVTNAPVDGLPAIVGALGLGGLVDRVVGDAGKPAGLPAVVADLGAGLGGREDFRHVFSIGDIWQNDLAPLVPAGATTALIDRHRTGVGAPTHRAETFDGLIPAVRAWAGLNPT